MIEREDVERLKEIFVTRQECRDTTDRIDDELSSNRIDFALIKQQLSIIKWVAIVTLGGIIGFFVTYILEHIVK